ncbi:hypothetical protein Cob_v009939 [Colletotrichum orbiculare MAFF 240422]|uniref:F-box domain-containing protein n=1 Tax=Colletotrichum orbiculare (strain 104-T / ATCC 96160 / CBS 514.97 / LARS 414 / MAFF 240422) TaxID=1213857 RepID=A0A484FHW1_COLOR|nr:hypothetical protein Cob_v009939 [Colletotrichum orbiculare MAFF 240422]
MAKSRKPQRVAPKKGNKTTQASKTIEAKTGPDLFSNLPTELVLQILRDMLDNQEGPIPIDFVHLNKVSRRFYSLSQEYIYRDFTTIGERDPVQALNRPLKFLRTICDRPDLASRINSLQLSGAITDPQGSRNPTFVDAKAAEDVGLALERQGDPRWKRRFLFNPRRSCWTEENEVARLFIMTMQYLLLRLGNIKTFTLDLKGYIGDSTGLQRLWKPLCDASEEHSLPLLHTVTFRDTADCSRKPRTRAANSSIVFFPLMQGLSVLAPKLTSLDVSADLDFRMEGIETLRPVPLSLKSCTDLKLRSCYTTAGTFAGIVDACKALVSVEWDARRSRRAAKRDMYEIRDALVDHRSSLENVMLDARNDEIADHVRYDWDKLSIFANVKTLGIPLPEVLLDTLPPKVESLIIFGWPMDPQAVYGVLDLFVRAKKDRFPSLKEVQMYPDNAMKKTDKKAIKKLLQDYHLEFEWLTDRRHCDELEEDEDEWFGSD